MSNVQPPDTTSDARPECNPQLRRRVFWSCSFLVILFAAGFLQFGLADYYAVSPTKRVNDGEHATFFAVHVNPYYVFSEDFHLYVVRAKRVLDRGWTDSPLATSANEQPDHSAPLQTAIMMLAVATDGRPVPYSLFIVGVLTVAWSIMYFAASRWLPEKVSPLSIPVAVLMTVLFESFHGLFHPHGEFSQWPVHRGLRIATLAWTSPLLLSLILTSVSLLFRRQRPWGRLGFISIVLLALALADTWAFLLALSCVAITILVLGIFSIVRQQSESEEETRSWKCAIVLTLAAVFALGARQITSGPMTGDVLTRAGFGAEWKDSATSAAQTRQLHRTVRTCVVLLLLISAAISIGGSASLSRRPLQIRLEPRFRKPAPYILHLFALAAVPTAGFVLLVEALATMGMDEYHLFQFLWRLEYVIFFCGILVLSEGTKFALRRLARTSQRSARWEIALTCAFLAALFMYHNSRIYKFVSRTVANEFFLTKDEEQLRDWIQKREQTMGKYSLVTASHELNYLCAYWSRADLLLPEGFPYHNAASNDEIECQVARVLQVYGATPEKWLEFNLHRHVWDQWSWAESRLLSARHGYMYYLMHRGLLLDGPATQHVTSNELRRTTRFYADLRLKHEDALEKGEFLQHRAGVDAAERVAERLRNLPSTPRANKPDVIVVDEVSQFLGTPDLTDYVREFQHGGLEAWVLKRDGAQTAAAPSNDSQRK